jgi:hypothetical protein
MAYVILFAGCCVVLVLIGLGFWFLTRNKTKKDMVKKVKTANKLPLQYTEKVLQGAANPWNLVTNVAKDGITHFMENAGMKLKVSYIAVLKAGEDVISHCQAVMHHPGGAIAVCTNESMDKFGYIREDPRLQGVFVGAVRGFKDPTSFGVETSVEALLHEVAEEAGMHVTKYLPLAEMVNGDNAFFVHDVVPGKIGGNDYYLVIFPDNSFVPADGDLWTLKQDVVTDKKLKDVVFESTASFDPMETYGAGIDGFLLTGWLLFKNWLQVNRPPVPTADEAFSMLKRALRA